MNSHGIQSELASLKKEIQREMAFKISEISINFQNLLQETKLENQKLYVEVAHSKSEIQKLKKELKEVHKRFQTSQNSGTREIKEQNIERKKVLQNINITNIDKNVKNLATDCDKHGIVPIEGKTLAEEESITSLEMDVITQSKRIDDGTTMSKTNLDIITKGIPYPMKSVAVKIINYAEMLLVNPEFFFKNQRDTNCRTGLTPYSIGSCTREALLFHDNHALDLEGMFTYQVGNTNLRLAVLFAVLNDASTWLFGVAFTPRNIETNQDLYNYISLAPSRNPVRPDVKFSWLYSSETTELVAKHGTLSARVTFMPGRRVLMEVEVMQILKRQRSIGKRLLEVSDGKTLSGKTVEGIAASIPDKYGCVLEITNGLDVSLDQVQYYDYNPSNENNWAELNTSIPTDVQALTRQVFYFSDPKDVHGMVSYNIASTDIRLAVMFRAFFGGNTFAAIFVPSQLPEHLVSSLTDEPIQWKTQPNQKSSKANDGEKVIEIRNIRARVTMSERARSILRVEVSTF
ncbi:unnamed protein product [Allacma fusca]|uniref:Uncharacterized protein n=1 Tax=Allacma fusca TaxID=39272 RepID=A0A8J2K3N3_9HEXA|nr:unnamed protein product [Allacma fusca]